MCYGEWKRMQKGTGKPILNRKQRVNIYSCSKDLVLSWEYLIRWHVKIQKECVHFFIQNEIRGFFSLLVVWNVKPKSTRTIIIFFNQFKKRKNNKKWLISSHWKHWKAVFKYLLLRCQKSIRRSLKKNKWRKRRQ